MCIRMVLCSFFVFLCTIVDCFNWRFLSLSLSLFFSWLFTIIKTSELCFIIWQNVKSQQFLKWTQNCSKCSRCTEAKEDFWFVWWIWWNKKTEQAYAKHKVMHKFRECRVLWGVLENLIKCWYCKPIYKSRKWHGTQIKRFSNYTHTLSAPKKKGEHIFSHLNEFKNPLLLQWRWMCCFFLCFLPVFVSYPGFIKSIFSPEKRSMQMKQMGNGWTNQVCMFFR